MCVSAVCPVCKTYDQIYNFPVSYEMVKLFLPSTTKSRYLIQGNLCKINLKSVFSVQMMTMKLQNLKLFSFKIKAKHLLDISCILFMLKNFQMF
jgi:hypothetical protein